jgi:ornithine carbamoyltransferase
MRYIKREETYMGSLIRLSDFSRNEVFEIFKIADDIPSGKYNNFLNRKTAVMFFPSSSIRTRVTFEKGIFLLGGQTIIFPSETLDKKEEIQDVINYLNNWADIVIVRHKDITMLDRINKYSKVPVINAMTDENHPCEIISDMYALSKMRDRFLEDHYLFCGMRGNIGLAWQEASVLMGFDLSQCCPKGYEILGVESSDDLDTIIKDKDIICTDSHPNNVQISDRYQITKEIMAKANKGAIVNPCPPFYCGEEVTREVIDSEYFVGYEFKAKLLEVQQAIIIYCLTQGI